MNYLKQLKTIIDTLPDNELAKKAENIVKLIESHGSKKKLMNAGLLKAGKSSLFNALCGNEHFETDVIRCTVKNKSRDLDDYILVDTPGLDANEHDTEVSFEGYKDSDLIIFVHNSIDGELSQVEIDGIKQISNLFGEVNEFLPKCILVLSNADQKYDSIDTLKKVIQNQCKNLFRAEFAFVVDVNSTGYMKGIFENKNLLVQASNINKLKELLDNILTPKEFQSLFNMYVHTLIDDLKNDIEIEQEKVQKLKEDKKKSLIDTKKIEQAIKSIDNRLENGIALIDEERKKELYLATPYAYIETRDYKEYDSKYRAELGAEKICNKGIHEMAASTRELALNFIDDCKSYFYDNGGLNNIKNKLFNNYNEIKEIYYSVNSSITDLLTFDIKIKKDSEIDEYFKKFDDAKYYSRYICAENFNSAKYYLTSYSSNLDIDCNYNIKWVDGLFGARQKEVKYYTWDISGAVDDIKSEAKSILDSKIDLARDAFSSLLYIYMEDINNQYVQSINNLIKNLQAELKKVENKNNKLVNEINLMEDKIKVLNNIKISF